MRWERTNKNIKSQKRNLAVATGKGLSVGTSNTLAIEMTYGSEAQPDIKAHMNHIDAWLRYYDKHRTSESKRIQMEAAWCKALANTDGKKKAGGKETTQMLSAMSATIISLRLVDMEPVSVHGWISNREGERGMQITLGDDPNVDRQDLLEALSTRFEERMWRNISSGEASGGLEKGIPSMEQAKQCHKWMRETGKRDQARCAESIAVQGVWNATRAHADKKQQMCGRCGEEPETLRHRYWECVKNKDIDAEDITQSQKLCEQAKKHWDSRGACYWNGGALPHNLRAEPPRRVKKYEAKAKAEKDFAEAMEREGLVATDGAGGTV